MCNVSFFIYSGLRCGVNDLQYTSCTDRNTGIEKTKEEIKYKEKY